MLPHAQHPSDVCSVTSGLLSHAQHPSNGCSRMHNTPHNTDADKQDDQISLRGGRRINNRAEPITLLLRTRGVRRCEINDSLVTRLSTHRHYADVGKLASAHTHRAGGRGDRRGIIDALISEPADNRRCDERVSRHRRCDE